MWCFIEAMWFLLEAVVAAELPSQCRSEALFRDCLDSVVPADWRRDCCSLAWHLAQSTPDCQDFVVLPPASCRLGELQNPEAVPLYLRGA